MPKSRHRKSGRRRGNPKTVYSSTTKAPSRKILITAIAIVGVLGLSIGFYLWSSSAGPEVTTPSGLKYVELVKGTGASPQPGLNVTVHYTGWLADGTRFESSHDRNQPYTYLIGTGSVIKGWEEGVMGMKVGGKRRLIIPPQLAYGAAGNPPTIPPNATLTFEVELLAAQQ